MSRLPAVAALAAALALVPSVPAGAADVDLAPLSGVSGLSAGSGQVVFSQLDPADGQWHLTRFGAGAVARLPIAPAAAPFDADVGSDARGRAVVTYSRCTDGTCAAYVFGLADDLGERPLRHTAAAGTSATRPSMAAGAVAFVRTPVTGGRPHIELVEAGSARPRELSGGPVQAGRGAHQAVDELDLGPRRVGYVWRLDGGGTYGISSVWDVVSAGRDGRPSVVLDTGLVSGTCGFGHPFAVTAADPSVVDYVLAGTQPGQDECDPPPASRFFRVDPATGTAQAATSAGGVVADASRDGATTYWLRQPVTPDLPSCADAAAACTLVASTDLPFAATGVRAGFTAADTDLTQGAGYRWVTVGGVRLLRPPTVLPCAPSAQAASLLASAQWSHGKHTVQALRIDPGGTTRRVGIELKRSLPTGTVVQTKLTRCGQRTTLTYVLDGRRVASYPVRRG